MALGDLVNTEVAILLAVEQVQKRLDYWGVDGLCADVLVIEMKALREILKRYSELEAES